MVKDNVCCAGVEELISFILGDVVKVKCLENFVEGIVICNLLYGECLGIYFGLIVFYIVFGV